MRRFKIEVTVTASNDITQDDFQLNEHDAIDGFEITRDNTLGDVTQPPFHLKGASIRSVEEIVE